MDAQSGSQPPDSPKSPSPNEPLDSESAAELRIEILRLQDVLRSFRVEVEGLTSAEVEARLKVQTLALWLRAVRWVTLVICVAVVAVVAAIQWPVAAEKADVWYESPLVVVIVGSLFATGSILTVAFAFRATFSATHDEPWVKYKREFRIEGSGSKSRSDDQGGDSST